MTAFRFLSKGAIEYGEAIPLADCDFITHAFLMRRGGVSENPYTGLNFSIKEGDYPERVTRNWGLLADAFGLSVDRLLVMNQQHGDSVQIIKTSAGEIPPYQPFPPVGTWECDALITDRPGIALVVKTADCVPLFILDRVRRIIGVVHAGWRGTALNIAGKAIDAFVQAFASTKEDILVAIGPAIGQCCYQVDSPVFEAFSRYSGYSSCVKPCTEQDRWMLDLVRINRLQIMERGVPPENICSADRCTSCHGDAFYSYRRDGTTGRQINFIMLTEAQQRSTSSRRTRHRLLSRCRP